MHAVKLYPYQGRQLSITELARMAGCSRCAMVNRLHNYSPEQAVAFGPTRQQGVKFGAEAAARKHPYQGQLLTVMQLAQLAGCSACTMYQRLKHNTAEQAVAFGPPGRSGVRFKAPRHGARYLYQGKLHTIMELAALAGGISENAMRQRLTRMSVEEAVAAVARPPRLKLTYQGRPTSARELARLAGCRVGTMYDRLRNHTPAVAVAMGKANHGRRGKSVQPPAPPATAAQRTKRMVDFAPLTPDSALARRKTPPPPASSAPVVIPANLKPQVYQRKPDHRFTTDNPPSTFGRIGQYLDADTHIARVYGGSK